MASLLLTGCLTGAAFAQDADVFARQAAADLYGNITPILPERRALNVYQNEFQRNLFEGYQMTGVQPRGRGNVSPFGLPGDLQGLGAIGRTPGLALPYQHQRAFGAGPAPRQAGSTQHPFRRFGGFTRRPAGPSVGDASLALQRQYALLAATSLTAPVQRANWSNRSAAGMLAALERMPFREAPSDIDVDTPRLEEKLSESVTLSYTRIRREAWRLLAEREYRRAALSFESASLLEPTDGEARVGECFAYLAVGAISTATTVMHQLARREINPFIYPVNMMERLASRDEAMQLRMQVQVQFEARRQDPQAAALHAFVLWYQGARMEALAVAESMAAAWPSSVYADWPGKMRAVLSAGSSDR